MKKRTFYLVLAIVVLIIIAVIAYRAINQKETYTFKVDKFSYTHRGKAKYTETFLNKTGNISVYSVTFPSRNFLTYPITIYGLLFIPTGKKGGVVLLPGGGVSKEAESRLANILAEKGYAVLTIDQRGIGETGGYYLGFDDDYRVFLKGDEPIQHLSVYDALRAYDVLKEIYGKDEIAMMGESMGGRYAMIAGAVEKRLKGVLVISSSGFHFDNSNPYLLSIDPDHYVSDIAPRPLVMLHGDNDSTVKIDDAKITYSLARQPKSFFIAPGCRHGYCGKMKETMLDGLKEILGE
ncbi:MAG TPA: alpha/beta hydrolase [Candidatus Nanoarchaeia archaeon]|nr:alpha/beta hydrolase [Candidatus Nanoarchaeia archaeon]